MFSFLRFKKNDHRNGRVYLDHAGATEIGVRPKVALLNALSTYGNPSGIHTEGRLAGVLLDKARSTCATALNAHSYEIYFMSSGTESCNTAIYGVYEGYIKRNKGKIPHMIVSVIEHPSILEPVRDLERRGNITVTYLPVYDNGIIKVRDMEEALTEETILVSVMYVNNEIGTVQPVKEVGRVLESWKKDKERSHTEYPYFHTDACQAANYYNLDVVRLRAHLMTVNGGKVYGGKGSALLYKREGIIVEHIVEGGGQERTLRSGTENVPAYYAFSVALNEAVVMRDKEAKRLRTLRDVTVEAIQKAIPEAVFYGAFDEYWVRTADNKDISHEKKIRFERRSPNNINCRIPGISSEEMILRLDAKGFAVSHKSACASMETDGSYVLTALGATEIEARENIRITMGRSTTEEDMKKFVEALKDISAKYTKVNG
jgi:cysteine desulfurase